MHLMIFSPGNVTQGFIDDEATNEALYDMLFTAATTEQGNGSGKAKKRERQDLDPGNGKKVRNRR